MDLFALGTPVVDLFAKSDENAIKKLGLSRGATNFFGPKELAAIQRKASKNIIHKYTGDNARNVCEGFAALGGFAGFQGAVGDDADGAFFEANLHQCGIATFLQERGGSTGKIIALVSRDGQRTFCADLGVSGDCRSMERLAFKNSRIFFLTSITLACGSPISELAMKYLELAKSQRKLVAISIESAPMVAKKRAMLLSVVKKYADVLFMNEDEAEALLGPKADRLLLKLKPKIPIYLKRGPHGSHLYLSGKSQKIPALPAKVIDTTGAGDAYAAGVLYGLSRRYTPVGSAKIGCILATKVVQKLGAGIPHAHTRIRIMHKKK